MNEWKNYGDKNFWDYGRLVKRHSEDSENEFDILVQQEVYDVTKDIVNPVIVANVCVDITDSWIKKENVVEYAGIGGIETEDEKIWYAIACVGYYGIHEFQPTFPNSVKGGTLPDWIVSQEEAEEFIKSYGVELDLVCV